MNRPTAVVLFLFLFLFLGAAGLSALPCAPSPTRLCLNAARFSAEVSWKDFQGNTGSGQAISLTGDTGYFWFFSSNNVELVVKVLDARTFNGHFWVFYGSLSDVEYTITVTDSVSGSVKTYANPSGHFGSVGDTAAFDSNGIASAERAPMERSQVSVSEDSRALALQEALLRPPRPEHAKLPSEANGSTATCTPTATSLCLNGGRFRVAVGWRDFSGNTGAGTAVSLTGDTGYFWFFSSNNVELTVKVLDARALNDRFWVFYGALSNVEYSMTVTDTVTGNSKTYSNPSGQFASVGDTDGLPPGSTGTALLTPIGNPFGAAASGSIGPAGGTLSSLDGRLKLTVPPGALAAPTPVSIQPITNELPSGTWLGYRLTPSAETFASPIGLSFAYADFDLAGTTSDYLRLSYQDQAGGWHALKTSTIDPANSLISVTTNGSKGTASAAGKKESQSISVSGSSDFGISKDRFLAPTSAIIGLGKTLNLAVSTCNFMPDPSNANAETLTGCDAVSLDPSVQLTNWAVNGVPRGNTAIGSITSITGNNNQNATFMAPAAVPSPNPVAASVDQPPSTLHGKITFVSNIAVLDCPIGGQPQNQCPIRYVGTTSGNSSEDGGLVTYTFASDITWTEADVQLGRLVRYTPSGRVKVGNVKAGACTLTLSPDSYDIQPLDGSLTIDFGAVPPRWGGAAGAMNWTPTVTAVCPDGTTTLQEPFSPSYFGDSIGGNVAFDGSGFTGTSTLPGASINYTFINAFRAPQ